MLEFEPLYSSSPYLLLHAVSPACAVLRVSRVFGRFRMFRVFKVVRAVGALRAVKLGF